MRPRSRLRSDTESDTAAALSRGVFRSPLGERLPVDRAVEGRLRLGLALDLGMIRSTITPTKILHSGSLALTALVIATSSSARVKARRFVFKYLSESFAMTNGNLCHPPSFTERSCGRFSSLLTSIFRR